MTVPTGEDRQELLAYRAKLVDASISANSDFDKIVTALASTALALTVGLVRQVGGNPHAMWLIVVSWGCITTSLAATLLSLRLSEKAITYWIDFQDFQLKGVPPPSKCNWASGVVRTCNWISLVLIFAGIVLAVVFAGLNVG